MRVLLGSLVGLLLGCGGQAPCRDVGCSMGQLCTDRPGVATTCEYRPSFACYAAAGCARQASGECGFTQSAALTACLNRVADGGMP